VIALYCVVLMIFGMLVVGGVLGSVIVVVGALVGMVLLFVTVGLP